MTAGGTWRVPVEGGEVTAAFDPAPDEGPLFICAHGAGGTWADRGVVTTAATLRDHGFSTVRFNFLYRERKSGRPDPMPRLMACYAAVVEHVRRDVAPRRLIIGGRSMGGRVASMLAAGGFDCDGLLLLAYPLHPPGQPHKRRDDHLPRIAVPALCVNGTRDEFCTKALMDDVVAGLPATFRMHWVDGADHGFHVLKSSGRTDADVMREIGGVAATWSASHA